MKTAIIIADGIKQIMLTPENDSEKQALSMITLQDDISLEIKSAKFYGDSPDCAKGYTVQKSQGGTLRAYEDEDSLMLVLTPKEKKK